MQIRYLARLIVPGLLICTFCVPADSDTAVALRFLTEHNPPGQYLDEHGQISGVTVELIRILQQRLNEHGDIELLPWARAFEIARTQPNIALFETARSADRETLFQWVGPVKLVQTALYGRTDQLAAGISSRPLSRLIACDYRYSFNIARLNQLGFTAGNNLVLTTSQGECFDMLRLGRVDLIILTDAAATAHQPQLQLTLLQHISETELYLAFSRDVSTLRVAAWQQALQQTVTDGTLQRLYQPVYGKQAIKQLEQRLATP